MSWQRTSPFMCGLSVMLWSITACSSTPHAVSPIAANTAFSVPVESRIASNEVNTSETNLSSVVTEPIVRVNCRATLNKDDELTKALVEQRMRDGNYYAALAQIQSLPSEVPIVAALRADILRQLQQPQAERWYVALQGGCLAGRAEHGLGLLAAQRQDYTTALKRLITAARFLPADNRVRNDLGYLYMHLNMDSPAEFELRTAYELNPEDKMAGFNLATLALLRTDKDAWLFWSARMGFSAEDREELLRNCQYLMRKRIGSSRSLACPMNPRLTSK